MTDEMASIPKEDARRIFDIACSMDQACSGYMDTDDVKAMRRFAVALGVDPAECTGSEFVSQFPHAFASSPMSLNSLRDWVVETREDTEHIRTMRPETDAEVIARVGDVPVTCSAGNMFRRCGKLEDDPIHARPMEAE